MASTRPYEGKLAIVTGGSRGLGAAVCHRLAAKGANLVIVYTSPSSKEPTDRLCAELWGNHEVSCAPVQADLLDPEAHVQSIVDVAREVFEDTHNAENTQFQIDILINCAGVASNQYLNDPDQGLIDAKEFKRVYAVNVLAPLLLTQAVAPHLPTDRSGRIVNVSSVSSSIGYEGQSVYAGSKAALEAMTRTWARELASKATVNAVNPGPIWSDMYANAGEKFWRLNQKYVDAAPLEAYEGESEQEIQRVKAMCGSEEEWQKFDKLVKESMGGVRPGFGDEVAGTIDMLCSAESAWTTGSVISANGGMKTSIA